MEWIPAEIEVHLVLENYETREVTRVRTWLARHPHYHVHFTPTSGRQLARATIEYVTKRNHAPKPFAWTADADLILGKVERRCKRISDSGH